MLLTHLITFKSQYFLCYSTLLEKLFLLFWQTDWPINPLTNYGTESLRSHQPLSQEITSSFIELIGVISWLQELSAGPCPEPVHDTMPCFFKLCFNIIFLFVPKCPDCSLPFKVLSLFLMEYFLCSSTNQHKFVVVTRISLLYHIFVYPNQNLL
jgi:hypothetical protein